MFPQQSVIAVKPHGNAHRGQLGIFDMPGLHKAFHWASSTGRNPNLPCNT